MELVDLQLPKKSAKELKSDCCVSVGTQEKYPWGLQIRFEKEQVEKIPSLTLYKVGDKVIIQAEATVSEVRMNETQSNGLSHTIEMQITGIACEPAVKKPVEKMSPKEYKKARESKLV